MNKYALVLFLGIVMIASTISISFSEAIIPENLPDVVKIHAPPFKAKIIDANGWRAVIVPLLTTTNDPSQYVSGNEFPGVAVLLLPRTDIPEGFVAVCSGALIAQNYILTAAHCVTNNAAEFALRDGGEARFGSSISSFTAKLFIDEGATQIHPGWIGDLAMGSDVAVLKLESPATGLTIYDIDRDDSDDLDDAFQTKVGFGKSGTLEEGDVLGLGTKRDGENKYDDVLDRLFDEVLNQTPDVDFIPGSVLLYDSDNGNPDNDAFGFFLGGDHPGLIDAVGRGDAEVNSAGGDSGGPTFNADGKITGITSFGMVIGGHFGFPTPDCNINRVRGVNIPDSSCGEFSGDMRVSQYFPFIDSVLSPTPQDPTISIDGVTLDEGNSPDTTDFVFTVTRSSTVGAITLDYATSDGITNPATAGVDYTAIGTTQLSFDDGGNVLSKTITVSVIGDTTPEQNETFFVNLTNCSGCTISDNRGVGTITNDDTPVGVSVDSIFPIEIAKGATLFDVKITGSGFQSGSSVTFENGCGPSPSVSNVSVSGDGKSITAEITAKSGGPKKDCTFDVRVTNPDASTDVLPQSFTVLR